MKSRQLTTSLALLAVLSCGQAPGTKKEDPPKAPTAATVPTANAPVPATGAAPTPAASAPAEAPKARPLYYEREITKADLDGRTLRELTLLRNTIYARAGNSFRKQWLDDYFRAQPWYKPADKIDEAKITALDRKNAQTIAEYDAAISDDDLKRRKDEVLARKKDNKATPEDEIELKLLSSRLGEWVGGDAAPVTERSPLEDPTLLDKQLTVDQLDDMSRRDLRLLRNTVYARKGRPFKSYLLQQYFDGFDWYTPDEAYADSRLSEVDRRNIKLIRSVEDSVGGPIADYDHMAEDGWFSGA